MTEGLKVDFFQDLWDAPGLIKTKDNKDPVLLDLPSRASVVNFNTFSFLEPILPIV